MPLLHEFFKNRFVWVSFLLFSPLLIYFPVLSHGFLHFDDRQIVTQNPWVLKGVTWESIKWAFLSWDTGNWIPLTWISHMLDVQFFGLKASCHHAVSILFHSLNGVLLFQIFSRMTQRHLLSYGVALIFVFHPMHIESVAWISERKDVLSTFFTLLSFLFYLFYAQKSKNYFAAYLASVLFCTFALMSKPMAVTLPLLLLVFDYWPLARINGIKSFWNCLFEKAPMVLMVGGVAGATWLAQSQVGAVFSLSEMSMSYRFEMLFAALGGYSCKFLIPIQQTIFYPPFTDQEMHWNAALGLLLFLIWGVFAVQHKRSRWIFAGGMIFFISLFPVLGLVKAGGQAIAERYTYFAYTGLAVLLFWGAGALISAKPKMKPWIITLFIVWSLLGLLLSSMRVYEWRSTEALFRSAVKIHSHNHVAHKVLADHAYSQGDLPGAAKYLAQGLENLPAEADSARPQYELNLAIIYHQLGEIEEAAKLYEKVLVKEPFRFDVRVTLGDIYIKLKRFSQAKNHYEFLLRIFPDNQDFQKRLEELRG